MSQFTHRCVVGLSKRDSLCYSSSSDGRSKALQGLWSINLSAAFQDGFSLVGISGRSVELPLVNGELSVNDSSDVSDASDAKSLAYSASSDMVLGTESTR